MKSGSLLDRMLILHSLLYFDTMASRLFQRVKKDYLAYEAPDDTAFREIFEYRGKYYIVKLFFNLADLHLILRRFPNLHAQAYSDNDACSKGVRCARYSFAFASSHWLCGFRKDCGVR